MTPVRGALLGIGIVAVVTAGWVLLGSPARPTRPVPPTATAAPVESVAVTEDGRKIKVRLFFVSEDGTRLTSVEQEVPYAAEAEVQARRIIDAQIAPANPPLVSAIPVGTSARAVFLAPDGTAFVDLSSDVATAHPGGSMNELLTIHTIVQALTTNLPAISAVQILIDGKEVDTLAGHVDTKRPLPRDDQWVFENPAR